MYTHAYIKLSLHSKYVISYAYKPIYCALKPYSRFCRSSGTWKSTKKPWPSGKGLVGVFSPLYALSKACKHVE